MPKYVYYDKQSFSNENLKQYFAQSRVEAADKEYQTNMPKKLQFDRDFTISKILIQVPQGLKASNTAKDTTLDDALFELVNNGVIELQVGGGEVYYFPAALALGGPDIREFVQYTLGTAADGSYAAINVNGREGLEVDIFVPANTDFKFLLKTKNAITLSDVKVMLIGTRA